MATTAVSDLRTDFRVIGLVSLAHGISHFFQLVVPPLFPMLVSEFDVSYAALGAMMTLFYAISGIAQTAAGFLVDRIGARRVLLGGLGVFAGAIAAVGLAPSFWLLFPLAIIAGIGNSVFHPADFAILNDRVGHKHLGRAYGVHAIAGNIGWALAPVASVGLAAVIGWRFALVALGCVGLAMVAMLAVSDALLDRGQPAKRAGAEVVGTAESLRLLMVTPILMCFAYFVLLAISMVGLQTFAIPTTMQFYETSLGTATTALTGFLLGGSLGILAGGVLADRTTQHHLVACAGILLASAGVAAIASGHVPAALLVPLFSIVGFAVGATLPSRDMLVRATTPRGASGKTYGFVYSGLDLGSALTPALFGWFLDHGQPRWVYLLVLMALLLSIATVLNMRRSSPVPAVGD